MSLFMQGLAKGLQLGLNYLTDQLPPVNGQSTANRPSAPHNSVASPGLNSRRQLRHVIKPRSKNPNPKISPFRIEAGQRIVQLFAKKLRGENRGVTNVADALKDKRFLKAYNTVRGDLDRLPKINEKELASAKGYLSKAFLNPTDRVRQIQHALKVMGYKSALGTYGVDGKKGTFTNIALYFYGRERRIEGGEKKVVAHLLNSAKNKLGLNQASTFPSVSQT